MEGKYMMIFGVIIFITQILVGSILTLDNVSIDYIIQFQLIAMILLLITMFILCEQKLKEFENRG